MYQKSNCVDERVHLAISPWDLTDDYNRHAGVTLLSFLDHCSLPVTAHILYDEKLSVGKEAGVKFNKQCYQEIADRYGCKLVYHHVELPEWVNSLPVFKSSWSPGTLMRLYLPDLLPDIHKIIYLDCDMVVLTDIEILWDIPLDGKYLAACLDDWIIDNATKRRKKYYNHLNIPLDTYFNAGMLLLNLDALRGKDCSFSETVFSYLKENPELPFLDQDLLNWFCQGDYVLLDKKYDVFSWWVNAMDYSDDCIIHYTIGKPWKMYNGEIDNYYWDYLMKTPWCKTDREFMRYLRLAPDMDLSRKFMSRDFFATVSGSVLQRVLIVHCFVFSVVNSCIKSMWNYLLKRIVI